MGTKLTESGKITFDSTHSSKKSSNIPYFEKSQSGSQQQFLSHTLYVKSHVHVSLK